MTFRCKTLARLDAGRMTVAAALGRAARLREVRQTLDDHLPEDGTSLPARVAAFWTRHPEAERKPDFVRAHSTVLFQIGVYARLREMFLDKPAAKPEPAPAKTP